MEKSEILEKIQTLSKTMYTMALSEKETFYDNAYDSLDCVDMLMLCEKEFNILFPDDYEIADVTPVELADYIYELKAQK